MRIGIVAADLRQKMVAEAFKRKNETVEWITDTETDLPDVIVLGMPVSDDGVYTFGSGIRLTDLFDKIKGKKVFGGRVSDDVRRLAEQYGISVQDYFKREEMTVRNVIPTVEGAIQIAMEQTDETLHGMKILICGFGRIGKLLALRLQAFGASVTVCARKPEDFAWCDAFFLPSSDYGAFEKKCRQSKVIFNTVPALLFDRKLIEKLSNEQLIIDLASTPGGVDSKAISANSVRHIHALALPGKVAPRTAGEIICKTIYDMLKEENTLD